MTDAEYMDRALELAAQGHALASPNPMVGAVLARDGRILGEAFYEFEGVRHAEVRALEVAAGAGGARGATLYVTLEPCSHQGRTGPCSQAVIAAGIHRVVAAVEDPNPRVSGRGFAQLRAAGIEIEVGLGEARARRLNEAYFKWIRTGLPWVTLKAGMTLDGKISTPPSRLDEGIRTHEWITSPQARWHVHQLRHQQDAILVGVGTVIADNPLLTDRTGLPRRRPLQRIILDSTLRLPLDSRVVQTAREDIVVFCSFAESHKRRALEQAGVRVIQVPAQAGRTDIETVMRRLGDFNLLSIVVEGGSLANWAVLNAGCVDKVFLYYAPKILGGAESVPLAGGEGYQRLEEAVTLGEYVLHRFGPDFAIEGYVIKARKPGEAENGMRQVPHNRGH